MAIVKFPSNHLYTGYGYDVIFGHVISYKRHDSGQQIGDTWQSSFKINGHTVSRVNLKAAAVAQLAFNTEEKNKAAKEKSKVTDSAGLSFTLNNSYILFSTRHECSQYFAAGTGINAAVAIFVTRGFVDLTVADVKILNPITGQVYKPKVQTVVTYCFE